MKTNQTNQQSATASKQTRKPWLRRRFTAATLLFAAALLPLSLEAAPRKTTVKKAAEEKVEAGKPDPQLASAKKLVSAAKLTTTQKRNLLELLNEGDTEALLALPGIGATRAKAITGARPFEDVESVTLVAGIGDATLTRILAGSKSSSKTTSKSSSRSKKK